MSKRPIYIDYHAHAPIDPRVVAKLALAYAEFDFNPHSTHAHGDLARIAGEDARTEVALLLRARPTEIVFTSGATEANNLAFAGLAPELLKRKRTQIIISAGEHASILAAAERLVSLGFKVTQAPLAQSGLIDLEALKALLGSETGLVSIAAANHELGTLQPIAEIAPMVRNAGALFHSDLAQAAGKIQVHAGDYDLASLSAHKLCGPVGIGALFVSRKIRHKLSPQIVGGGQEGGLRSGTLPVPLCVAFGSACSVALIDQRDEGQRVGALRNKLLFELQTAMPDILINGTMECRLPGNLNLSIPGVDAEALVMRVRDEISISTGSACTSNSLEASHVLLAIGLHQSMAESAIRIGLGRFTSEEDVSTAAVVLIKAVRELRNMTRRVA